jgi:hypothetical protein
VAVGGFCNRVDERVESVSVGDGRMGNENVYKIVSPKVAGVRFSVEGRGGHGKSNSLLCLQ